MADKPIFTEVLQVGLVVHDLEKTMQQYADIMGIGPWDIYMLDGNSLKDIEIYGKPQKLTMNVALCNIGNVQVELIEPGEHGGIYTEHLEQHGEGLHHIACAVDDFDETISRLAEAGIGILMRGVTSDGMGFAYMDSAKAIGTIIEIYDIPEGFTMRPADRTYDKIGTQPVFKQILQVGLVVSDLEKSMRNYSKVVGIDSWDIVDVDENFLVDAMVRGRRQTLTMKAAMRNIGSVQIELVQPMEYGGIYKEFLEKHGDGLNHIACAVDDYEETLALMTKAGIGILQSGGNSDGAKFAYLDTEPTIACITEIYNF